MSSTASRCPIASYLSATNEEHKAGHSADAIQARHICEVVKVIADVVLQEADASHLPSRLQEFGTISNIQKPGGSLPFSRLVDKQLPSLLHCKACSRVICCAAVLENTCKGSMKES